MQTCHPICHFDEDCPDNEVCFSDGKCMKNCTLQNPNCPQDHICDKYEKICLPKCQSHQDCLEELECFSDGSCLKICQEDSNCDMEREHCDK